ncbi:tripartite tricarboxylate transporter TctB family protein [Opitutia bacterium ISCC 51]|nr:tripartite tricarboxylate transporter TctB family protein [Opitutae bacterium ISCC 51]QXD29215.1 tripartite tricarboxylate transporter TctB family protein [Opitutae bacterium ISCC 52]
MTKLHIHSSDIFIVLVGAAALAFRNQIADMPAPFDAYPNLVTGALILLALACLIQSRLSEASDDKKSESASLLKAVLTVVGIAIYIFAISRVGYFVSSTLYLVILFHLKRWGNSDEFLETKPLIADTTIAIVVVVSIAIVFKLALNLVFPEAWLF